MQICEAAHMPVRLSPSGRSADYCEAWLILKAWPRNATVFVL